MSEDQTATDKTPPKTKLEQVQFRLQFMSLCNAAGRLDDMNDSFLIAWKLVDELVEEEKGLKE